ncbi:MAG: hypothetical protein A2096_06330, partial [Spirochaetes bacterium GWF1_41_5]
KKKRRSSRGIIGAFVYIANCNDIENVNIMDHAKISGVFSLKNGTIDSCAEAQTIVGSGVIAEDFIFQKGSEITSGAVLSATLVGEGCVIGKQFSSENSVFFANSTGHNSETCSVLAGPYTVTHHKSTLLIAGIFSFFNAGSGTNQSNHMYKLGPLSQGIFERGAKTGSSSYILYPARIGAYSVVIGSHYSNCNTSEYPFSYIVEENGRSILRPAVNFFKSGLIRDCEKWPARDRRKTREPLDLIHFHTLSPYVMQKIFRAEKELLSLYASAEKEQDYIAHKGVIIPRHSLRKGAQYYKMIAEIYFGENLVKALSQAPGKSLNEIFRPAPGYGEHCGEWIDACGLLCSLRRMDAFCLSAEKMSSYSELLTGLRSIYNSYAHDAWNWFLDAFRAFYGFDPPGDKKKLLEILDNAKEAVIKRYELVLKDARYDYDDRALGSFGIDGNAREDFTAVRGNFENNQFVIKIKSAMEQDARLFNESAAGLA